MKLYKASESELWWLIWDSLFGLLWGFILGLALYFYPYRSLLMETMGIPMVVSIYMIFVVIGMAIIDCFVMPDCRKK